MMRRSRVESFEAALTMTNEDEVGVDYSLLRDAIAHDLNNLLTTVLGCSDELSAVLSRNDPARRDVDEIRIAAEDASLLVKLLDPRASQSSLTLELLDLDALLRLTVRLVRKLISRKVSVQLDSRAVGLTATGDSVRVLRILLGLVISIGNRLEDVGVVLISAASRDSETILRVDGSPACTGEARTAPLELVHLAHSMNGSLRGLSGAWELILPTSASEDFNPNVRSLGLERVIVAEPDDLLRSFLVSTMGATDASTASDAATLFELLEHSDRKFDLALISINLANLDPQEDYPRIRKLRPDLMLAFIGSNGSTANHLNALLRGDDQALLLYKPFGVSRLISVIADMMKTK